jgi:hypothetical protein
MRAVDRVLNRSVDGRLRPLRQQRPECDKAANSPTPLTRHSPYHRDKLSRLAPPPELIERHSTCGIRSLAEGRRRGAHFAEMFGAHPFFIPQDNSVADMTDTV